MPHDPRKLLADIRHAAGMIAAYCNAKSFDEYLTDPLLQSATERWFEIVGEALSRLVKVDAELVNKIDEYRRIIDFRNRLIHGYNGIDHKIVWGVIEKNIPHLIVQVDQLLSESN
jgi:uncharacterized protein with HEPN domain